MIGEVLPPPEAWETRRCGSTEAPGATTVYLGDPSGHGSPVQTLLVGLAAFLMLNLVLGLVTLARGPAPADRMLGVALMGTTGVALLLALAHALARPAFEDVALMLALLAALVTAAFHVRVDRLGGAP